MSGDQDKELIRETRALLEPGDIELHGVIVYTEYDRTEELAMHDAALTVGSIVAEHATAEDWYVYSGNDDPEFGMNQHQALTIDGDEFIWECQQLVRDGAFVIVFYYEASADHAAILTDIRDAGFTAEGVE